MFSMLYSLSQAHNDSIEPNPAFGNNEKLKYLLYYGFIKGGEATLELEKKGTHTMCAKAKAKTIGLAKAIVDIDDVFTSYFNEYTGKPYKAIRDIKEGDYKFYNEVRFDHANNKVHSQKSGEVAVPPNIYDIVSAFYYARNAPFKNAKPNDTIIIQTYFADEVFPFMLVYNGKEIIKTKSGKYHALKFTPVVETGRIFKESDDMRFWVSDDKNCIPLRFEFDLILGSIKCDLIEYEGIKNEFAKIK